MAVTQKYLCVTTSYEARALGVSKMMGVKEAKRILPSLVLVNGEDLTPYRAASKRLADAVGSYAPSFVVQPLGLDEFFVDVSREVHQRVVHGQVPTQWTVPEITGGGLGGDGAQPRHRRRPAIRVIDKAGTRDGCFGESFGQDGDEVHGDAHEEGDSSSMGLGLAVSTQHMVAACEVAGEVLRHVGETLGFRCSAGVAVGKAMAKVANENKPGGVAVLLPSGVDGFMRSLPLAKLPGVGWGTRRALSHLEVDTCGQLLAVGADRVRVALEGKSHLVSAARLLELAGGFDRAEVVSRDRPGRISCEDSFKVCRDILGAESVLATLVPDLVRRLRDDCALHARLPSNLTLEWRQSQERKTFARSSAAVPVPAQLLACLASKGGTEAAVGATVAACSKALKRQLPPSFNLTLLNVGVSAFRDGAVPTASVATYFAPLSSGTAREGPKRERQGRDASEAAFLGTAAQKRRFDTAMSKHEQRVAREGGQVARPAAVLGDDSGDEDAAFWFG